MTRRFELTDEEWERLARLLPASGGRGGRWADHRRVVSGILYRVRTGVPWRDLPERFGPWKTCYERHRRWSADGTWRRILDELRIGADLDEGEDWTVGIDSTSVRAHQHAAGAGTVRRTGSEKGTCEGTNPTAVRPSAGPAVALLPKFIWPPIGGAGRSPG